MTAVAVAAELEGFRLLSELTAEEREALADELDLRLCEPGEPVFAAGDSADALLLILEGEISLGAEPGAGRGTLGPGQTLGALALVVDQPRAVDARAATPSRVLVLRRAAFEQFSANLPGAACKLLTAILREHAALVRQVLGTPPIGGPSAGTAPGRA